MCQLGSTAGQKVVPRGLSGEAVHRTGLRDDLLIDVVAHAEVLHRVPTELVTLPDLDVQGHLGAGVLLEQVVLAPAELLAFDVGFLPVIGSLLLRQFLSCLEDLIR